MKQQSVKLFAVCVVALALASRIGLAKAFENVSNCQAILDAAAQRQCVISWVDKQKSRELKNAIGSTCSSRGPSYVEECVLDWVITQQLLNGTGVGGCAGVAHDNRWTCVAQFVFQQQSQQFGYYKGRNSQQRPDATCASIAPGHEQQACINQWVDEMRKKQYGPLPGVACASRGPNYYQDCVTQWVIDQQQIETGGAPGGCAGTNKVDGSQLACVNQWVLEHQAMNWTPSPDKPKSCKNYTPEKAKDACYNAWVLKHQELHSRGPSCAKGKTVKKVQLCITDYVARQQRKQGAATNCKMSSNREACVRSWIEKQMTAGGR